MPTEQELAKQELARKLLAGELDDPTAVANMPQQQQTAMPTTPEEEPGFFDWIINLFSGGEGSNSGGYRSPNVVIPQQQSTSNPDDVARVLEELNIPPDVYEQIQRAPEQQRSALLNEYMRRSRPMRPSTNQMTLDQYRQRQEINDAFAQRREGRASARDDAKYARGRRDRDAFISQLPESVQTLVSVMTDADLSDLATAIYNQRVQQSGGNVGYKAREDYPRLKILMDEAYTKAGLKPGETVCIKV